MDFGIKRRAHREVNLIPLINVIFLLMIFFMVVGSLSANRYNLPTSATGNDDIPGNLEITIDKRGLLILNHEIITEKDMVRIIKQKLQQNNNGDITINADAEGSGRFLLRIMKLLKSAGVQNIVVATIKS